MSSCVYIQTKKVIPRKTFEAWAEKNNIIFSPQTIGGDTFYNDQIQVCIDKYDEKTHIDVSSYYGQNLYDISVVAKQIMDHFEDSTCNCDPELEKLMEGYTE